MFKKIIASIVLVCFLFVNIGSRVAYAQDVWYYQEWQDWMARVYDEDNPDEIFGERYAAAQVEWVIYGLFAFILNHVVGSAGLVGCVISEAIKTTNDFDSCFPYLTTTFTKLFDAGVIPSVPDLVTYTGNESHEVAAVNPIKDVFSGQRPISGIGYLKSIPSKFNPVEEVKAQGFGFEAAGSMRELWVAVRNITYFFLVIILIGMSFMIMFRFKISPQTIITVQSALPKVVITLLLITFSYAIAGFMIDLLYVVIGIIAAVLSSSGLFEGLDWAQMYNRLTGATFGTGIVGTMVVYFLTFTLFSIFSLFSTLNILQLIFALLLPIILIIVLIALIVITLKTMWMLLKTFVTVLLLIATGPIFIIVGGFGGWIKNLASNLAVFAVIGPMFAISFLFLGSSVPDGGFYSALASILPFSPELNVLQNSNWSPPFLGMDDMDVIWLFASFVIITLIPNVANIIKGMIQRRPFGYGTAVGAAIGVGAGAVWSPIGTQVGAVRDAWAKERAGRVIGGLSKSKVGSSLKRFMGM